MPLYYEEESSLVMSHIIATLRQEAERMVILGRNYSTRQLEEEGYLMYQCASNIELQWEGMDMIHDRALMENCKTYPV